MSILTTVLINPLTIKTLSEPSWELLVRQARAAKLLGRLFYLFNRDNLVQHIEEKYLWHFEAAYRLSDKLTKNALRELDELTSALDQINVKPIFLKGAAYQGAELPCSNGRLMSDIDLLVDKSVLSQVQEHLRKFSWLPTKIDDYDEKYYREWMHEIPPLKHATRLTTLDVHHNILPLTNKNVIDPSKLNYKVVKHDWFGEILTLDSIDTVIHSSVHLFTESEFPNGLRDLSDLDMLIRHFSELEEKFLDKLIIRANELNLANYINLAIRYTSLILETPFLGEHKKLESNNLESKLSIAFWDFCFINIFRPHHSSTNDSKMKLTKLILYWRGHFIKMPLNILIPHLATKSYMQLRELFIKEKYSKESI